MEKQIRIKKKCGGCKRIRPLGEFKSSNSKCEHCNSLPVTETKIENCYKCEKPFEPINKYNKICPHCKESAMWATTFYTVDIY